MACAPPCLALCGGGCIQTLRAALDTKKALLILPALSNGAVRHRAVCARACVRVQARLRMCTPSRWKAARPSWWRRRPAPVLSSSSRKARTSPARSVLAQRSCSVRRCAGARVRGARCPRSGPPCALLTQCPHSAGLGLAPQPRRALAPRHTYTSCPPRSGHCFAFAPRVRRDGCAPSTGPEQCVVAGGGVAATDSRCGRARVRRSRRGRAGACASTHAHSGLSCSITPLAAASLPRHVRLNWP